MDWSVQLGGTARSSADVEGLHALGLEFAEVAIRPEQFAGQVSAFSAARESTGLFYLCHGPREGDPNDIQALRSIYLPRVTEVLSLMPRLGMRLLTLHLWLDPRFVGPESIRCKIGILEELLERARHQEIDICLENLSETADHLSRIFRLLPLLNLTLDLGHGQLLTRENTSYGFIEEFPERIRHVHLHDNRGGNSPSDDLHLPVGEGDVPVMQIFERLKSMGYKRTISLELSIDEIRSCLGRVRWLMKGI